MKGTRLICLCLVACAGSFKLAAQDTIFDKNTLERIPYYEQLYRFRVHRMVDLDEKQNSAFKSPKSSIVNFIIDLMVDGDKLKAFDDGTKSNASPGDLLPAEMRPGASFLVGKELFGPADLLNGGEEWSPKKNYLNNDKILLMVKDDKGKDVIHVFTCTAPNGIQGTDAMVPPKQKKGAPPVAVTGPVRPDDPKSTFDWHDEGLRAEDFNRDKVKALEIVEDVVFDKRRSRLYYDILAIGVATVSDQGDLGTKFYISYKEFAQRVSEFYKKDMASRRKVMWQNRYNPSENRTFTDAFKLRLFHGVVSKVENPDDLTITQVITNNGEHPEKYNESVFMRWEEEMKMMEKEHNLWEF